VKRAVFFGGDCVVKKIKYIIVILIVFAILVGGYLIYTFADSDEYMAVSENGYWRGVVFTMSTSKDYKYDSDLAVVYQGNEDGNLGENVSVQWYCDENENQEDYGIECEEPYKRQNLKFYLWNTINKKYFYQVAEGEIEPDRDKKIAIEIEWKEKGKTWNDTIYMNIK